jgi:hypothetical protein
MLEHSHTKEPSCLLLNSRVTLVSGKIVEIVVYGSQIDASGVATLTISVNGVQGSIG